MSKNIITPQTHHNDPAVDLNIYDQLLNNENTPA